MNILKKYWNSAYSIILLIIPALCMCAGAFWSICKSLGYYPEIPWIAIVIFDLSQILYMSISLFIIFKSKKDTHYVSDHLFQIKCYIMALVIIQYSFILLLFPSPHTWECTILFLFITTFFFDTKLQLLNSAFCTLALIFSYLMRPDDFLPGRTEAHIQTLSFQIVIYALTVFTLIVIVRLAEMFLIRAQENRARNARLLEQQLDYYKQLDLMDKELRKFRHDIHNHFLCMDALLKQENNTELIRYFKDLQDAFGAQKQLYYTGNTVTDAILNYELNHHCNAPVHITIDGILPDIHNVSSMDICTVFSNMLTNAIHTVNLCTADSCPELTIRFQHGKHYFSITVSNSKQAIAFEKPIERISRNHGHGLNIIKETIEKYNGSFEQTQDHHLVTTTVILPL